MRMVLWIFWLAMALVPATAALSLGEEVAAFPGAEGFGAAATGGRGGRVLVVDRTADDPKQPAPGTLRWACESQSGPRIVVFRTAGIVELSQSIVVRHPDLTIAAQTAPGEGICLRGSEFSIQASNVIVRGLRSRPGDGTIGTPGQYRHALAQATILEPWNPVKLKRGKTRIPDQANFDSMRLNVIENSWIAGPSTREDRLPVRMKHPTDGTRIYLHDNAGPMRPAATPPGERELVLVDGPKGPYDTRAPAIESSGLTIQSNIDARTAVLRTAGAIAPVRDAVDRRIVRQVREGTGRIIDAPGDVGGYPAYRAQDPLPDADQDGMPDVWEKARKLDPRRPDASGHDLDPQYDNIEVYINGLFDEAPGSRDPPASG